MNVSGSSRGDRAVRGDQANEGIRAGDLRALARIRATQAWTQHKKARTTAESHHLVQYVTGFVGVVAGAVAGLTVLATTERTLVAVAAFVASSVAGFQTVLKSQARANQQWSRRAGLGRLAQDYETLAVAHEEPTKADMDSLAERWEQLFGAPPD